LRIQLDGADEAEDDGHVAAFLGMWGLMTAASMAPALLIAMMFALGLLAAVVLFQKAAPFRVASRPAFAVPLAWAAVVAWTI
jgi:hypothetical protein